MAFNITLANTALLVTFRVKADHTAYLAAITVPSAQPSVNDDAPHLPLVEIRMDGIGNHTGQQKTGTGLVGGGLGARLKYSSHRSDTLGGDRILEIDLDDEKTGVVVTAQYALVAELPVLRARSTIKNNSSDTHYITQLSSLVIGDLAEGSWWDDHTLHTANNSWFREAQWQEHSLPSVGLDDFGFNRVAIRPAAESMAYYSLANKSTFTTQGHLPMGILKSEKAVWVWQIENNGAWRWDVGDYDDELYLATSGPEGGDWNLHLAPGQSYQSPTTALCLDTNGNLDQAFASLTRYRRTLLRPHQDHKDLPIIFNDYMNCLLGDPTDEKILALLDPVAASGAEYFVIDAGWYADDGNWWDDVGGWEPSKKRFPMGFPQLLERIKAKGLKPGLWIEPEVIGVRNVLAQELPFEAFFQRNGHRILERGRYHLDYRHPAVIKRMNSVIDRLVNEYGARYFKFDYNIEHILGTDIDCSSPGVGQADHGQAYLAWVRTLLDRYPDLVIENCSSGAQRMEYDMLAMHTLQSTSDQQDPVLYAAIAAAIPTAVLPEQGATWAYPQPSWSDEINAMTVANSLLGRIHLSGRLDLLSRHQLDNIVYEGMRVYQSIKQDIRTFTPFWPLGLPKWHDKWLALGMQSEDGGSRYLMVWKRGGSAECEIPLGLGSGEVRLLYPKTFQSDVKWADGTLRVKLDAGICARLYHIKLAA